MSLSTAVIDFDKLGSRLHDAARDKGFYDSLDMTQFNDQAKQLMMIVSEVSEVMEALRKSKGEDEVLDEISDILIRVFDFAGALRNAGVVSKSLDKAFLNKVNFNSTRPKMHGVLG